jgi:hypothetical protein
MTPYHLQRGVEAQLNVFQNTGQAPPQVGGTQVDSMRFIRTGGSIFGERIGGEWTFYVQKRVTVEYQGVGASLGRQQLILGVEEFWPNPTTGADM